MSVASNVELHVVLNVEFNVELNVEIICRTSIDELLSQTPEASFQDSFDNGTR